LIVVPLTRCTTFFFFHCWYRRKRSYQSQKSPELFLLHLVSKKLDKQTIQINKSIMKTLQPLEKHMKSADKQSELTKRLQSQLKQLQKQVSQIQRALSRGKEKKVSS
jgi:septal ring factor EnvC (AmiA/AmiB activator)